MLPQASHHDITLLAHGHEDQDARGVGRSAEHLEAGDKERFKWDHWDFHGISWGFIMFYSDFWELNDI